MSTYTQILYHVAFSTKSRKQCLVQEKRDELCRYAWGIIKNKKSHLYQTNGGENHLHILTSLHPTVCLSDFVKDIKTGTSKWIKAERVFPGFTNWQDGYAAFTHSIKEKDVLIEYIKRQQEHHKKMSFKEELRNLLQEAGVEFDERYVV